MWSGWYREESHGIGEWFSGFFLAHAHAMFSKSTTRPPMCVMYCWNDCYVVVDGFVFDHYRPPSTINFYMNNIFFFLYPTFDNTLIQRLIILLSNVWHNSYPTFDNTFVQRLIILLSNVDNTLIQRWQYLCPTFGNTFVQRLAILLSNVWQYLCPTFGNTFVQRLAIPLSNVWQYFYVILVRTII